MTDSEAIDFSIDKSFQTALDEHFRAFASRHPWVQRDEKYRLAYGIAFAEGARWSHQRYLELSEMEAVDVTDGSLDD